jgi:hypothetical protein
VRFSLLQILAKINLCDIMREICIVVIFTAPVSTRKKYLTGFVGFKYLLFGERCSGTRPSSVIIPLIPVRFTSPFLVKSQMRT